MPRTRNAIASTAARTPRIVTTRTPLFMRRDGANMELIWGKREAIYFCQAIWTSQIALKWLAKFTFARSVFAVFVDERTCGGGSKRSLICPTTGKSVNDAFLEQ
jgi:hypothetical protein